MSSTESHTWEFPAPKTWLHGYSSSLRLPSARTAVIPQAFTYPALCACSNLNKFPEIRTSLVTQNSNSAPLHFLSYAYWTSSKWQTSQKNEKQNETKNPRNSFQIICSFRSVTLPVSYKTWLSAGDLEGQQQEWDLGESFLDLHLVRCSSKHITI